MDIEQRARRHAALGDVTRLAIVDDLSTSDRSPRELAERHGLPSNLLAHHLDVLQSAGLIDRMPSAGDGRRRYVRLDHRALAGLSFTSVAPADQVLFVCTHNSARSQLAAAAWSAVVGTAASSAGTHPAAMVHPGAVAAATRAGFDLSDAVPRRIDQVAGTPALIVTVCDRAHEELDPEPDWWHWSIPDPVGDSAPNAFDRALEEILSRVTTATGKPHEPGDGTSNE